MSINEITEAIIGASIEAHWELEHALACSFVSSLDEL
jgi:hypothetical protein